MSFVHNPHHYMAVMNHADQDAYNDTCKYIIISFPKIQIYKYKCNYNITGT